MSGAYYFDNEGIYRCRRCKKSFEPGHNKNCDGPPLKTKIEPKIKKDRNEGQIIDDGMRRVHESEE